MEPKRRELFYRGGGKMMAVEIATEPTFSAGKPRLLFEREYVGSQFPLTGIAYDVSPDGQRFLMVKDTSPSAATTQINVVLTLVRGIEAPRARRPSRDGLKTVPYSPLR